ncbi:MAG: hypothetical protein ACN0LA_00110 [Candidatus Longimicrobiales bacterium M2_2A_002]
MDAPTVRDSAGILIADNPGPDHSAPYWTLGTAPDRIIGSAEWDMVTALYRVVGAARLKDGRIVVANSGTTRCCFTGGTDAFYAPSAATGRGRASSARWPD